MRRAQVSKRDTRRNLAGKGSLEEMIPMGMAARQVKGKIAKRSTGNVKKSKQQSQVLKQVTVTVTVMMNQIQELSLGDYSCQDLAQVDKNCLYYTRKVNYLAMMLWAVIVIPLMKEVKVQPATQAARPDIQRNAMLL